MTLEHTVEHGLLKEVQAVAQLQSGRVAVAAGTGLHLLNGAGSEQSFCAINRSKICDNVFYCMSPGNYDARISDECYVDVGACEHLLYAIMYGVVTRSKMHVYSEEKPWDVIKTIVMPSDGLCTIDVSTCNHQTSRLTSLT